MVAADMAWKPDIEAAVDRAPVAERDVAHIVPTRQTANQPVSDNHNWYRTRWTRVIRYGIEDTYESREQEAEVYSRS